MSGYLSSIGFAELVEVLDRDKAVDLCVKYGGQRLPSVVAINRLIRDQAICHRFDGKNIPELAKSHGMSERQVRRILFENAK